MRSSHAEPQELALLRTLALIKGYDLEPSTTAGRWRLVDRDLKPARGPNGALTFTPAEAKAFLVGQRDI